MRKDYANERVKITASADYPDVVGFHGTVDAFGLKGEGRGYYSGGIKIDKLGYYFFPYVLVEVEDKHVTRGYN